MQLEVYSAPGVREGNFKTIIDNSNAHTLAPANIAGTAGCPNRHYINVFYWFRKYAVSPGLAGVVEMPLVPVERIK